MKTLIICLSLAGLLFAQEELLVNSEIAGAQRDPQIEWLNSDAFLVAWSSTADDEGDIYLSQISVLADKTADETRINTHTYGEQEKPALATDKSGHYIVTWVSHNGIDSIYDIKARGKFGEELSDEFLVNSTIEHSQTNPDVAMHSDGSFIIVWESWFQDGSDRGIYAQRFKTNGDKDGSEFLVNTHTAYSQARPSVKYFDNGSFIVVWESWKQDIVTESGYGVFAQLFDAMGEKTGNEFQINSYTNDYQWFGDVVTFADGTFIAAWCSWQQDGDRGGIYLQKFAQDGSRLGNEVLVNDSRYHYQWLPRIKKLNEERFAVVYSSWEHDLSREAVLAQLFDVSMKKRTFETQVNLYTDSYQWEPDFIPGLGEDEIISAWSSWGQLDNDYEVMWRWLKPTGPIGYFDENDFQHTAGRSTFEFTVHVLDSAALINADYEISFSDIREDTVTAHIKNITTNQPVVTDFVMDRGENTFYLTPVFEGIAVELKPVFDFNFDPQKSYLENNSGTNMIFSFSKSAVGVPKIAPIDIALIWGSTDTLSDGSFANPSGTAMGHFGTVSVPFKGWNLTDNEPMDLFVTENTSFKKGQWQPTEKISFLTPESYRDASNNTHVEISQVVPADDLIWPAVGDTNFIFTRRPQNEEDTFIFRTSKNYISSIQENSLNIPRHFKLNQNYPNPFNPTTTIPYTLPRSGKVRLEVYNVLGQKVKTLINGKQSAGSYRVLFDGRSLASGTYFTVLKFEGVSSVRKMLLLK